MIKKILLLMILIQPTVFASAIAQYKAFIATSSTMKARFIQTVDTNDTTQTARGILEIARPGRFRWTYHTPYKQIIIGREKMLWIYDVELSQVTQKAMDRFMSPTYEMLLSGSDELESSYDLTEEGAKDGVEWLLASSKKMSNIFRSVRMAFKADTLVKMELVDRLGQKIVLTFSQVEKNIALADQRFILAAPKGVRTVVD